MMLSKKSYLLYLLIIQVFIIILFDQQNVPLPFHNKDKQHLSQNITHNKTSYQAVVAKRPILTFTKTKLALDLIQKANQSLFEPVQGRILLTIPETCYVTQNSIIRFTGTIKKPKHFINPGGFDYKKYLQRQGVWGKAYLPSCKKVSVIKDAAPSLTDWARQKIFQAIHVSAAKNKDLILQLILGILSITQENQIRIQEAGLSHLFAISGTHFGIMCALIFFFHHKTHRVYSFALSLHTKTKNSGSLYSCICYSLSWHTRTTSINTTRQHHDHVVFNCYYHQQTKEFRYYYSISSLYYSAFFTIFII